VVFDGNLGYPKSLNKDLRSRSSLLMNWFLFPYTGGGTRNPKLTEHIRDGMNQTFILTAVGKKG
jgi:hypothetical protein